MLQLLLATRNPHKTREFGQILGPDFALSDLTQHPEMPEVEETGVTFEENAILKTLAASRVVSDLVVADDSGLEVAALRGAPGVWSARYAGVKASDQDSVAKLLKELKAAAKTPEPYRARFRCVLALAHDGKTLRTFEGTIDGTITTEARGRGGFGYDPIFVPEGYELTFAELSATDKNRLSHRAIAISRLKEYLSHTDSSDHSKTL